MDAGSGHADATGRASWRFVGEVAFLGGFLESPRSGDSTTAETAYAEGETATGAPVGSSAPCFANAARARLPALFQKHLARLDPETAALTVWMHDGDATEVKNADVS